MKMHPAQPSVPSASSLPHRAPYPPTTSILRPTIRRRLLAVLLVLATLTSLASTATFLAYLLLPLATPVARTALTGLYMVGITGLWIAEACQILGVLLLISLWVTHTYAPRRLRELVVLLLSLIPYMPVLIFLVTFYAYLRLRRAQPRLAPQRQQATQDLKDQAADTFVDAASNASSSSAAAASPAAPPAAAPRSSGGSGPGTVSGLGRSVPEAMPATTASALPRPGTPRSRAQEAIRRVVGPSTSQVLSGAANVLAAVALVALLLSAAATATTVAVAGAALPVGSPSSPASAAGGCSTVPTVDPQATTLIGAVRHTTEVSDWQTGMLAPQNDLTTFSLKQPFGTAVLLRTNSAGTLTVHMTFCATGQGDPAEETSSSVPPKQAGMWYLAATWFYDTQRPQDVGRVLQTVFWNGTLVHVSFLTIASTDTPHPCPAPVVSAASDFTLSALHVDAAQISETGVSSLTFTYVAQRAGTLEFFVCIDGDTFLSSSHQLAPGSNAWQAYQDMIQDPGSGNCLTCQDYGAARWIVVWNRQVVAQVPLAVTA